MYYIYCRDGTEAYLAVALSPHEALFVVAVP